MEKFKGICPVCEKNTLNVERYSEYGIGTVEIHAHCKKCTYGEEMSYSKPFCYMCETDTEENKKKARELGGIRILPVNEYEQIR